MSYIDSLLLLPWHSVTPGMSPTASCNCDEHLRNLYARLIALAHCQEGECRQAGLGRSCGQGCMKAVSTLKRFRSSGTDGAAYTVFLHIGTTCQMQSKASTLPDGGSTGANLQQPVASTVLLLVTGAKLAYPSGLLTHTASCI